MASLCHWVNQASAASPTKWGCCPDLAHCGGTWVWQSQSLTCLTRRLQSMNGKTLGYVSCFYTCERRFKHQSLEWNILRFLETLVYFHFHLVFLPVWVFSPRMWLDMEGWEATGSLARTLCHEEQNALWGAPPEYLGLPESASPCLPTLEAKVKWLPSFAKILKERRERIPQDVRVQQAVRSSLPPSARHRAEGSECVHHRKACPEALDRPQLHTCDMNKEFHRTHP